MPAAIALVPAVMALLPVGTVGPLVLMLELVPVDDEDVAGELASMVDAESAVADRPSAG
ncbi:MAG: hypothetical protein ABJD68_02755 [Nakamurella sp.]